MSRANLANPAAVAKLRDISLRPQLMTNGQRAALPQASILNGEALRVDANGESSASDGADSNAASGDAYPNVTLEQVNGVAEASGVNAASIPFDKFVVDHLDFVWRSLKRFGVPPAEVDDATQQVFLIAHDKLALIRGGSERAFLISVAVRVASNTRRANQRRENAQQQLSLRPVDAVIDPELHTQRSEARDLLDRVLDNMPPDVRAVFVLFELEELSIGEVADYLAIPRGTVATRLRRARVLFHEAALLLQDSQAGVDR
ncbi:MAG TPA: sigma-70 family RNA polymerase sigma factor [Polyangiaceae bacterium]|nr:sigma-70 family RNA polymerase sigma factor [Polyangiaceae bacterium]